MATFQAFGNVARPYVGGPTRRGLSDFAGLRVVIDGWRAHFERRLEAHSRHRFAVAASPAVLHIAPEEE